MNRFNSTLAVALLASAGFGATALAQDKPAAPQNADKTQVVPSKEDLKPYPPTVEKLDANTQRIHDRDRGTQPQGNATNAQANRSTGQQAQAPQGGVRDWDAIDANNDNLISPDEMEAALKEVGPQASKTADKK